MDPLDEDDRNKKRRNPFDFMDDDEFEKIFEHMQDEINRLFDEDNFKHIMEEMMRNMNEPGNPNKRFVHGFSLNVGPDGKPRIQEFFEWKKRSESELRKRFEIEKTYLKSQVDALKLNARWAKPYLKSAERLMESEELQKSPALVTAFNTVILEICLLGKNEVKVEEAIIARELPEGFLTIQKRLRKYYSIAIVDFVKNFA